MALKGKAMCINTSISLTGLYSHFSIFYNS